MSLLDDGVNFVNNLRTRYLTHPVTYNRGPHSVDVAASVGKTIFRITVEYGLTEHYESKDFLINTGDLVLGGNVTLPERGDTIEEVRDGVRYVYEVSVPSDEPHFRFSDPFKKVLRIHTKEIDSEVVS